LLALRPSGGSSSFAAVEYLAQDGDMRKAAAGLFAALRRLDGMGLEQIIAEAFPEQGLGLAIMDRLRRCAAAEP
jgi:L-threonylcarbamoyladenylate synthase